jgi:hypothetical protein
MWQELGRAPGSGRQERQKREVGFVFLSGEDSWAANLLPRLETKFSIKGDLGSANT